MTTRQEFLFLNLPIIVQEKILKYFSYAELSRLRSVSKHIHNLCSEQLNQGFFQLENAIHNLQKQIKTKLPRRESERHKHPLSTKFDIISSLDSRIQWLKLTFNSSIQHSLCCFYPGRLLDEIYSVLFCLKTQQTFLNSRTILQETRDMSSMAIEHFREHIESKLQDKRVCSMNNIRNNLTINSQYKRTNPLLNRKISILKHQIYKQNLRLKMQKFRMKHYKYLLSLRTKSLIYHHHRLKYLEKKTKQTEQILLEIRNDNDILAQRFDQFMSSNSTKTIGKNKRSKT